ncbi:MAG: DUF4190 domain-containing protein [Phycisphaerales bacterium JB038]
MIENPYEFEPPSSGGAVGDWGETPPPPPGRAMEPMRRGTSGLAIASLICSLLLCLPFLGPVLGLGLGITALARISASGGRLGGRGLALAGVVIGAILLLAEGCLGLMTWMATDMAFEQTGQTIRVIEAGDLGASKRAFAAGERDKITEASLAEFREALQAEFGTFRGCSLDWSMQAAMRGGYASPPPPGSQQIDLPVKLEFSKGTAYALVRQQADQQGGRFRTLHIVVYPDAGEPLLFPPREIPSDAISQD